MAKKKRKKYRPAAKVQPTQEVTSTEEAIHPDATLGPDADVDSTSAGWMRQDSTNAPELGEADEAQESYVQSQWALVDKYILGRRSIPFLLVTVIIGWILIQDNGAGELSNWGELWWSIKKCGVIVALFLVLLLIEWVYTKFSD